MDFDNKRAKEVNGMMHTKRRHDVVDRDAETVAKYLNEKSGTWCLCAGFRVGGLLVLNDSTSEDALQEYAIIRESDGMQLDSLTVSWISEAKMLSYLDELDEPECKPEDWHHVPERNTSEHGSTCRLCA